MSDALVGKSAHKVSVGLWLPRATVERLDELAAEAGMARSRLASMLIEELVPTITSARMRLQVTRSTANGGQPSG